MRTTIVVDDQLMKHTMRAAGVTTKRDAVERGLKVLVRLEDQEKIRAARGKLHWAGDLEAMRRG
jgi:Arc/MetJ family transcription regulator